MYRVWIASLLMGGLLVLALAPAPEAHAAPGKLEAKDTDKGDFFAFAELVSVKVKKPKRLWVRAQIDRPGEKLRVDWLLKCSKGSKSKTRDGGFKTTRSPALREIKLPIRKAKSCKIRAASAEWQNSSQVEPKPTTVTIEVRAKKR